jgi:hypothetical protein
MRGRLYAPTDNLLLLEGIHMVAFLGDPSIFQEAALRPSQNSSEVGGLRPLV